MAQIVPLADGLPPHPRRIDPGEKVNVIHSDEQVQRGEA
jgi:hypothetical protein